jgi:hypothetical protein
VGTPDLVLVAIVTIIAALILGPIIGNTFAPSTSSPTA